MMSDTQQNLPSAMYREDVGDISFLLGTAGNGNRIFRGGFGLRHIAAKRSAVDGVDGDVWVRERLPEILARGHLQRLYRPPNGRRADIVLGRDQVTLSLMRGSVPHR
jgi:hypothetical protein